MSETYLERIDEHPGAREAGRLGRHIQHDSRSRQYAFDTAGITVADVRHLRNMPVFDQGDIGSCTGNAAVGCLGTDPLFAKLPLHPDLTEALALKTYQIATTLDEDRDAYPPVDTGSTGLAAAKALQQQGLIVGYQHTFTFEAFLKALRMFPVMLGINWYSSFDKPLDNGLIRISHTAQVRGGHEVYADEIVGQHIGFTNSWTSAWGRQGRAYLSFDDVERLLSEKGDVTVPVPSGNQPEPAPVPAPPLPPSSAPEDVALYTAMKIWAASKALN